MLGAEMKCSVYICEFKLAECNLIEMDPSMCVAGARISAPLSSDDFSAMLISNGANIVDGIINYRTEHGLRVMDEKGNKIPSIGAVIMFAPDINEVELNVYGIEGKYYDGEIRKR